MDLLSDFVVYALIPVAVVWEHGRRYGGPDGRVPHAVFVEAVVVGLLEASFFLNATGWLFLSATMAESAAAPSRLTTVVMPRDLVEGTESLVLFTLLLSFNEWALALDALFFVLVVVSCSLRARWAWCVLLAPPASDTAAARTSPPS